MGFEPQTLHIFKIMLLMPKNWPRKKRSYNCDGLICKWSYDRSSTVFLCLIKFNVQKFYLIANFSRNLLHSHPNGLNNEQKKFFPFYSTCQQQILSIKQCFFNKSVISNCVFFATQKFHLRVSHFAPLFFYLYTFYHTRLRCEIVGFQLNLAK